MHLATEKSRNQDVMTLEKIKGAGGTLMTVDDQRVWTNSEVLWHRVRIEKERGAWRTERGMKNSEVFSCGQVFKRATLEQIGRLELEAAIWWQQEYNLEEYVWQMTTSITLTKKVDSGMRSAARYSIKRKYSLPV